MRSMARRTFRCRADAVAVLSRDTETGIMKVRFFTAIYNVEISSIPGRGDEISHGLRITTDKSILSDLLITSVKQSIGNLEVAFLLRAPAIIHSVEDVPDDFDWLRYLNQRITHVKAFFNTMWLFQDNAADSELGFLTYQQTWGYQTHSNALSVSFFMADGTRTSTSFSRTDLKSIRAFHRKVLR